MSTTMRVKYLDGYNPEEYFTIKDITIKEFSGNPYLEFLATTGKVYPVTYCEFNVPEDPHLIVAGCAESF